MKALKIASGRESPYVFLVGTGGIGSGIFYKLEGNRTLGRNESRAARLLDWNDYCKLHIVLHYISVFLGADPTGKGFKVLPIGNVGEDDIGRRLLRQMANAGMDVSQVKMIPQVSTLFSVCFQYPDGSGGNITTNNSASSLVALKQIDAVEPLLAQYEERGIAVALPEVPLRARGRLLELGTEYGFLRVSSFTSTEIPKAVKRGITENVDLIALNVDEARAIANISSRGTHSRSRDEEVLERAAAVLTRHNPNMKIVITAGPEGAYGYDQGKSQHVPCFAVKPVNTAGAGDAYLSGLIISIVAGLPFIREDIRGRSDTECPRIETSMDFASLLASLKVTSKDTIHTGADAESLCQHAIRLGVKCSHLVALLFGLE